MAPNVNALELNLEQVQLITLDEMMTMLAEVRERCVSFKYFLVVAGTFRSELYRR